MKPNEYHFISQILWESSNKKADDANEIERLKNELTEVQIRLSKAQEKDIPINATDRKTVIFWQIASVLLALAGFLIGISVCRS